MKVVFFGTPEFALPSFRRLLMHPEFDIVGVITQPDRRRGRGNQATPAAVKAAALDCHLPIWQPHNLKKDSETLEQLRSLKADVFVVVAYGQILSQTILDLPRLGCVNCHGSILPKYRGAAPIQWALYHGETTTGITTMLMDAGMDTGATLFKSNLSIALLDSYQQVATTLADLGADLLIATLLKLAHQEVQPRPQDEAQATYAPLLRKQDFDLDWSRSALDLHNQIRGFANCVTLFRGTSLKIIATVPLGCDYWCQLPSELQALKPSWPDARLSCDLPGQILGIAKGVGPIVATGQGGLLLCTVQLAGKRLQSGWDFANGVHLSGNNVLGS